MVSILIDIWTTAYTDPLRVQRILSHAILFESELRWTWFPPGHIPCWITFGYSSVVMWNSMWDIHLSTDPYRSVLIGESCTVVIEHFQSWRSWLPIMVSSDSVPFGQGCVPLHMGWSSHQWSSIMKRWQPWCSDMNHVGSSHQGVFLILHLWLQSGGGWLMYTLLVELFIT